MTATEVGLMALEYQLDWGRAIFNHRPAVAVLADPFADRSVASTFVLTGAFR